MWHSYSLGFVLTHQHCDGVWPQGLAWLAKKEWDAGKVLTRSSAVLGKKRCKWKYGKSRSAPGDIENQFAQNSKRHAWGRCFQSMQRKGDGLTNLPGLFPSLRLRMRLTRIETTRLCFPPWMQRHALHRPHSPCRTFHFQVYKEWNKIRACHL